MLGRYLARGLAGETDVVRARDALSRAWAGGVAEAEGDLAALPSEKAADETRPADPEAPATVELAGLEPPSLLAASRSTDS